MAELPVQRAAASLVAATSRLPIRAAYTACVDVVCAATLPPRIAPVCQTDTRSKVSIGGLAERPRTTTGGNARTRLRYPWIVHAETAAMKEAAGVTFLDALRGRVEASLDACTRCGKCVAACPMIEPAGIDIGTDGAK